MLSIMKTRGLVRIMEDQAIGMMEIHSYRVHKKMYGILYRNQLYLLIGITGSVAGWNLVLGHITPVLKSG